MNFINQILDNIQNLSTDNYIDLAIAIIIVAIFKFLSPFVSFIAIKIFRFKDKNKDIKENAFYKPLKAFITLLGIYIALFTFNVSNEQLQIANKVFKICTIFLVAKAFAGVFDNSSKFYKRFLDRFDISSENMTLEVFSKIIKALIYIIAGFIIITELGYNLGGLATGLGISSVVIALAAQDVAKNILAGISILTDKPFKINDYIQIGDFAGTVESITFRSTRIRNANNEIVVIPNSIMSDGTLINCTLREKRRYNLTITLEQDTSTNKVQAFNNDLIKALNLVEEAVKDTIKVHFTTISDNGIDISIDFLTTVIDYLEYLKFKEKINFLVLEILEKNNISLAYNSQSIYIKK